MKDKSTHHNAKESQLNNQMLAKINQNEHFSPVFNKGQSATQNVTLKHNDHSRSYILLGYPMKAQREVTVIIVASLFIRI